MLQSALWTNRKHADKSGRDGGARPIGRADTRVRSLVMGVGDSIKKAAENAMEDLAGTSDPHDDARVPEPGDRDDDIQVHSSISEGSNAMDEADDYPERQGAAAGGLADRSDEDPSS